VIEAISAVNDVNGGTTTGALGCQVNSPSTSGFAQAIATAQVASELNTELLPHFSSGC
jgi:hypothetical protein